MSRFQHWLFILLLFALTLGGTAAHAQSSDLRQPSAYWQYDAPGPVGLVITDDIDADGIDEFILSAQESQLLLVGADGREVWAYETPQASKILKFATLDLPDISGREIVLLTKDELILLDGEKRTLWRKQLELPPIPTALLTGAVNEEQQERLQSVPVDIVPFRRTGDTDEFVVLFSSGQTQLYDTEGNLAWEYEVPLVDEPQVRAVVGDVDRDGTDELLLTYFDRFTRLILLDSDSTQRWDRSLSGRVTSLSFVDWDGQSPLDIAVGNSIRGVQDRVIVYDAAGNERWYRTPNRPVTSLAIGELAGGSGLVVGTSVGTLVAYDRAGNRMWRHVPSESSRGVVSIAPSPGAAAGGQPAVAYTLVPSAPGTSQPAIVALVDANGHLIQTYAGTSDSGETRLVDVNGDGITELLLVGFGTISLADPGTGARTNALRWEYRLFAAPTTMLVADLDLDGVDELMLGDSGGRFYLLEGQSGQARVSLNLGGEVAHMALLPAEAGSTASVVVAHNLPASSSEDGRAAGWVEIVEPSGRLAWSEAVRMPGEITALAVGNINRDVAPEIIVGTGAGEILALSQGGRMLWRAEAPGQTTFLGLFDDDGDGQLETVGTAGSSQVFQIDQRGQLNSWGFYSPNAISSLEILPSVDGRDDVAVLATRDGTLRGLTFEGTESWRWTLPEGAPAYVRAAGPALLVANDLGTLYYYDLETQEALWQVNGLGEIGDLHWGDLDGGGSQDLAIGNRNGRVVLFSSDMVQWDSLGLNIGIFGLNGLKPEPGAEAQLVVVSETGVVELFEAKPNRPPLLVNPEATVGPGRYSARVNVIEEPNDEVQISLEVLDAGETTWTPLETRRVRGSRELEFSVDVSGRQAVSYRFTFDDGTHRGSVTPPPGPAAQPIGALRTTVIPPLLLVLSLVGLGIILREAVSVDARARRFYRRLKQQPQATLELLESQYMEVGGSPDFLLNVASRAHRDGNEFAAAIIDGMFLLAARPAAGINLILGALNDVQTRALGWRGVAWRQQVFTLSEALLEAPSTLELSLVRPQLAELVQSLSRMGRDTLAWEELLRVLTSIRDSERVDLAEDRVVYLHEATVLLRQLEARLATGPRTVENRLALAIAERWHGLLNAAMEMVRGQAQLAIALKTQRVVPENGSVLIAVSVCNHGHAAAENVVVVVEEDPAYAIQTAPQVIPFLAPGREHQVSFRLTTHVSDRFRIALRITYGDRSKSGQQIPFADMVHLLPPKRDFSPIPNPYLPGTPLRGSSPLFYGREDLFTFIGENVGHQSKRDVLIMVGQRRTGKTSMLLRLDQHLPPNLIPVYIDCQSLGVTPGMAALFNDFAWHIADALASFGYEIDVPDIETWRKDPTRKFQRDFIRKVQAMLPADAKLLLVFDEFEAFESLVDDGILPPTLFTFMRHLMQHSDGLSFVFVGTRRLEEMTSDYWSVFFNIALYRQIGFLSRDEAVRLITEPVSPEIVYDDLALDKIWRVTAGHPYFLQLVSYTLVKQANQKGTGYVTISDVNAALEEMLRLGEVHFAYLWQRSSHVERALLTAVAHLMERDVPFHPSDLVQYLEQYGFRFDPADVTAGLNRLVEREIMREVTSQGSTLYELRIGLVGLWAAQNKSLSKLYESRTEVDDGRNGHRLRKETSHS